MFSTKRQLVLEDIVEVEPIKRQTLEPNSFHQEGFLEGIPPKGDEIVLVETMMKLEKMTKLIRGAAELDWEWQERNDLRSSEILRAYENRKIPRSQRPDEVLQSELNRKGLFPTGIRMFLLERLNSSEKGASDALRASDLELNYKERIPIPKASKRSVKPRSTDILNSGSKKINPLESAPDRLKNVNEELKVFGHPPIYMRLKFIPAEKILVDLYGSTFDLKKPPLTLVGRFLSTVKNLSLSSSRLVPHVIKGQPEGASKIVGDHMASLSNIFWKRRMSRCPDYSESFGFCRDAAGFSNSKVQCPLDFKSDSMSFWLEH